MDRWQLLNIDDDSRLIKPEHVFLHSLPHLCQPFQIRWTKICTRHTRACPVLFFSCSFFTHVLEIYRRYIYVGGGIYFIVETNRPPRLQRWVSGSVCGTNQSQSQKLRVFSFTKRWSSIWRQKEEHQNLKNRIGRSPEKCFDIELPFRFTSNCDKAHSICI